MGSLPVLIRALGPVLLAVAAQDGPPVGWDRIVANDQFFSEGAHFADIDRDGKGDVVSGPYWYPGPGFKTRREYRPSKPFDPHHYSDHFFTFTHDVNGDGWVDIIVYGFPGKSADWYENPKGGRDHWARHRMLDRVDNESPTFGDLTGDGKPEVICSQGGYFGFASPDPADPAKPWIFRRVSDKSAGGQFRHGLGYGDVNGDGRKDLLENTGWWEQPPSLDGDPVWKKHPAGFGNGGSQMHLTDVDGDGDADVITAIRAHGYGISWFEQVGGGAFREHRFVDDTPEKSPHGVCFSQPHAMDLVDIDGDGLKDLVTGKRWWAHGPKGDVDPNGTPVLYWFRLVRGKGGAAFVPYLVDDASGVGTQVVAGDVNGDGKPDIVVGNKRGTFVHLQKRDEKGSHRTPRGEIPRFDPWPEVRTKVEHVAKTEPLAPEEERARFHLPPGFVAQLVACEPDIQKPMNLAFDARGRLWVTGSVEYPHPAKGKGRDTVRILEDFGPDGRARKITTFADDLNIPIGILPLRDGALVHSIPNIWRLRDTDGDGKADERTIILEGFGSKDTHGMTNSFRRGPDGWVYATHGFSNTSRIRGTDGSEITLNSGNTYRFRPDGTRVEQFTWGQVNPFGMTFDPWGNIYTSDCHSKPLYLLLRGAYYPSFGKKHDGLGFAPVICPHNHGSTGIAGVAWYADGPFPSRYHGTVFIGNPVTSRINHDHMRREGSTPVAVLQPDFLISRDPWFRPVDVRVGPDGALYVADFYNRIIGHYEVPLDHPGRDRTRGRIWRIVYRGSPPAPTDWTRASVPELVRALKDGNLGVRATAVHELVHRKVAGAPDLWVRERTGGADAAALEQASGDLDFAVRTTVMRILAERSEITDGERAILHRGLADASAMVRRAAADALGRHPSGDSLERLLAVTPADPLLGHALKIAVRNQFKAGDAWNHLPAKLLDDRATAAGVARAAMGTKDPAAAAYLLRYLERYPRTPDAAAEALSFIARFGADGTIHGLVSQLRGKGSGAAQFAVIRAIVDGLTDRGAKPGADVRAWAEEVVVPILEGTAAAPAWTFHPAPSDPKGVNPWEVTTRRSTTDGRRNVRLLSSIPRGEQRVGTVRSPDFEIPARLAFWICGHNGFPGKPDHGKNRIVLKELKTGKELARATPPRNDTARQVTWDLKAHAGKRGYLEATDGDAANAYAWMAFGLFDPSVVALPDWNAKASDPLAGAIDLAGRLRLVRTLSRLEALARDGKRSGEIRQAAIGALAAVGGPEVLARLAASVPSTVQRTIASGLAGSRGGGELLLSLIEQGKMSGRLLRDPAILGKLRAAKPENLEARVGKITAGLPPADQAVAALIRKRRAGFETAERDGARGAKVVEKVCMACHQVGGKGKNFAPSLDGVGNRGLDRLLEDILDPSRNVDQTFRTTLLRLRNGEVRSGLLLREEDQVLVMVDDQKKEVRIPKEEVERRKRLPCSPMPANVTEGLTDREFYDLLEYLLGRRVAR